MEVEIKTGIMLSIERYNEAIRLLTILAEFGRSEDVGVNTRNKTLDWLENVSGKPWQNCTIPGCYMSRRCLVKGEDSRIYPCRTSQSDAGDVNG